MKNHFILVSFSEKDKTLTDWQDFGKCVASGNNNDQEKCSGHLLQQRKCSDGTIDKCDESDLTERNQTCRPDTCPTRGKKCMINNMK